MPSRAIPVLGYTAATLVAAYLMLIVATVSMAAWQTNLAMEVHETEQDIARLEGRYYAMVADIDRADPGALGLVKPARVTYAETAPAPAVSLR
ncbi:MAG TPA: hypothetical protein PK609_03855 [Candidatus Paceibacterota bacterium]|nr:hypothetical protein [Candidatus Paceibacterota bacterium]